MSACSFDDAAKRPTDTSDPWSFPILGARPNTWANVQAGSGSGHLTRPASATAGVVARRAVNVYFKVIRRAIPCEAMSETSSNWWKIRVIHETGCWKYFLGRASRTSGMAA